MGLTFADIQNLSRDPTQLYPPRQVPVFAEPDGDEQEVIDLQLGFIKRLRESPYYIVERTKSNELPRYSDKYRPSLGSQPMLKKKDLNPDFFPREVFEDYFNPKKKRKVDSKSRSRKGAIDLDEFNETDNEEDKSDNDRGSQASEEQEEDYDVDEEYDNDYAENYFDNGEDDDYDNLGDGGADEGGGGELVYFRPTI
ncbi:hypothetical protein AGABI1DRAFT_43505 [Agaricus bisporus var. burnettii JB137-S8]|uniref:DNA-directed RNA polymerase III subunit n=1 Tax=Agaricus bisporus var. burnettii (strain JB137-S8 / ATCC MYA-4627 / FGSC 10392) TaxID=597362 RepID=K5XR72_AGABU|nr:hypothetical protein AGABI2DRAFT_73258 [Agaricus bisporus var. bisporus H97]XP_007331919.1 uncharacterized protein AGABI1DRAFT_43505 [Agaricus bisporus var. burnettii JB137-S8]EKM77355.1 hypothetical protein AGABI1DRAFT_43505 [Agaricus bisporus var. burnettii JB137-S8]EKV45261.1 hypothetical protein AGABI2DRAFT_73258 [Agaricus bisporus var. bisporus H97]